MNLVENAYNYLMSDILNRIKSGKTYDVNFKPFPQEAIKNAIKYFERLEKYEDCQILSEFFKKNYNHENNYKLKQINT
jgi:predicted transcriptional regulator